MNIRELFKDEVFMTAKTWDGELASIPQSMVKEFKEEQERLKAEHLKTSEYKSKSFARKKCGKLLPEGSKFCLSCGAKQTKGLFLFDKGYPKLDINRLAFTTEEECEKGLHDYYRKVKRFILTRFIIIGVIICIIMCLIVGRLFYNKGFDDNQPIAKDSSPIVYITPSGTKYHKKNCKHIDKNKAISISANQAKDKNYTPCSSCY